MKYKFNFGNSAAAIPCDVKNFLDRAGLCEMRVFVYLCACAACADIEEISASVAYSHEEVSSAISFWRGTGLLTIEGEDIPVVKTFDAPKTETKAKETSTVSEKKILRKEALPQYTSDELAKLIEERSDTAMLIEECQKILGKMLNVHEINVLVGLVDYLNLDNEYILLLVKHCAENGKKTLHYIERTAFGLYDMGIHNSAELTQELSRREAAASAEGQIRKIFGIGTRKLTSRESIEISSWVNDLHYSMDIIEKAYEITVDATSKPTLHYANTVLERWHSEGLDTLDKIIESYKDKEKDKRNVGIENSDTSSFDTDMFFEAAVKRSLGEE